MPDCAPTLAELAEIATASLEFFQRVERSFWSCPWKQEDHVLRWFIRMADALRPVRSNLSGVRGWPHRVKQGLGLVIQSFDAMTIEWGWERVAEPEPARSAYLGCRDSF